jgi:hypothetical protein
MKFEAVLISQPSVDFSTFLGVAHSALGYSPAASADASGREMSDSERFLSCLAAIRDREAVAGMVPGLLGFVSFSVLMIGQSSDLLAILSAPELSFIAGQTLADDIHLAVCNGTLSAWREAVRHGASATAPKRVRTAMLRIKSLFDRAGLGAAWSDMVEKQTMTGAFLEDKRVK